MSRARCVLLLACLLLVSTTAFAAGIPIRGRVLDSGGAALAKARVRLVPVVSAYEAGRLELEGKDGPEAVATGESGADGVFRLEAPGPGMWTVMMSGDGLVPRELEAAPLTGEMDLPSVRLQRERKEVRAKAAEPRLAAGPVLPLRVLGADGKPAAGVLVRRDGGEALGLTGGLAGEEGTVDLAAPGGAPLDLVLIAADGRRLEATVKPFQAGEPRTPRELRLPASAEIAARVVSAADGRPLPGALVWSTADPGGFRRTDARGEARLPAPPGGPFAIQAAAAGFLIDVQEIRKVEEKPRRTLALSLQPDIAVTGKVVDEAGRPVAGAEITADVKGRPPSLPVSSMMRIFRNRGLLVRSGPDGHFRWGGLAGGIDYELRVTKEGFAPTRVQAAVAPGRPASPLRIVLQSGRSAFGKVLGPDRRPVPGVQVTLKTSVTTGPERFRAALAPESLDTFEAVTGADGRFDLLHLPAGRYDLTARGHGWAPLTVRTLDIPAEGRATDLGTLVLAPGVVLEGSVVDSKEKPVEGAAIHVMEAVDSSFPFPMPGEGEEPAALSGADGFFRIEDLRSGSTVNLSAVRTGYATGETKGVEVPAERPVRIALQEVGTLSGQVVDPDGKPIAGATVRVDFRSQARFLRFSGPPLESRSDPEGLFRIKDVTPGPVDLVAQASGWQAGTVAGLELRSGEDKRGIEITLSPAAVLAGRVLGPSGRAVPDAQVRLAPEDRQSGFHMASTDDEGRYELDSLPPGLRTLEATHPDHGTARRQVELRAGDNSFDISLEGGNEVTGRVVDGAGTPVAGAQVWLVASGGLPASMMSQSDGSFRFAAVADGSYRAGVDKEGFARSERVPVTVAGSSVSGLELRLTRGGAIVGRITGVEAAELSRVQIVAWGRGLPIGGGVGPDGSYRIDSLQAGEWRVRGELSGTALYAEGVVQLESGASEARLDLEMERGHELSGRVRRGGAPVSGETLLLEGPGQRRSLGETDADGRFRFPGLAAGSYRVRLEGRSGGSRHEETVDLQSDQDITIDLPAAEVTGRVVNAEDGSPLAEVSVQLLAAGSDSPQGQARSDSRGLFVLRDVAAGSWRLRAQADGYAPAEAAVRVDDAGRSDEVELQLRATEGVSLQVATAWGPPPRTLFYVVLDGAGRKVGDGTAAVVDDGRARLTRVPAGGWQLLLSSESTAVTEIAVTAPGDAGRVTLPPPCNLRVRVPALADAPVPATVSLIGAGGRPFRTFARFGEPTTTWDLSRGGSASLSDLPPGTWDVRVTAADGRTWRATATTAPGAPAVVVME